MVSRFMRIKVRAVATGTSTPKSSIGATQHVADALLGEGAEKRTQNLRVHGAKHKRSLTACGYCTAPFAVARSTRRS